MKKVMFANLMILMLMLLAGCTFMKEKNNIVNENNKVFEEINLDEISRNLYEVASNSYLLSDEKMTYEDVANNKRLSLVSAFVNVEYIENGKDFCINDTFTDCYRININEFENKYYDIFGDDKEIKYENFYLYDKTFFTCDIYDSEIQCVTPEAIGYGTKFQTFTQFDKAESVNDNIVVYFKLVSYKNDSVYDDVTGEYPGNIYSDYNCKNKLDNGDYFRSVVEKDNVNDLLIGHYEDKTGIYKTTFKKNGNNYNWYSIEKIK